MVKREKTGGEEKGVQRLRLARIAGLALVVSLGFALALVLILRQQRNFYWSGRNYSFRIESLNPGGPFADEGWWVRKSWSGPTGQHTHEELYGVKFGKRLLCLDVLHDPIAAINKRLPKTVSGLLAALDSKEPLVKHCAGGALVKLVRAAQSALPTLLKRHQQGDEGMEGLILELAKTAGVAAIPALSAALGDAGPKIRQMAAGALGEIGAAAAPAVPKLAEALHDPVPAVVMVSAMSLRKIDQHDHGEVSALIGLFNDKDPQVRAGAIVTLGEFGEDAKQAVPPLMKILESGNAETAGLAARTLGLIGPAARPAIPLLIARLEAKNSQTLMFSMEALGRFGEAAKAAIPKLLQLAEQPDQMWGAISALSSIGTDAVPGLIEVYRNGKQGQHSWVARAFMKLGPKAAAAVPALVEDLDSVSASRTVQAALALGCIGGNAKVAVPRLSVLIHDADAEVRIRAAEALWRLDHQTNAVIAVMVAELKDWSKDPNALLGCAKDAYFQSRQQVVAEVLGEIGPAASEAVPLLQFMLRSSFEDQRASASKALNRIVQP